MGQIQVRQTGESLNVVDFAEIVCVLVKVIGNKDVGNYFRISSPRKYPATLNTENNNKTPTHKSTQF